MLSYNAFNSNDGIREVEYLPFRLRLVTDDASLKRAVGLRQEAYARHMPEFAAKLGEPEPSDQRDDVVVLLAESKLDGVPLSTMRIQTNARGPLMLEASLPLPAHYTGLRLAEATRLGVAGSRDGQLAKRLMFKAYFLLCLTWGVDRMVITARRPLDRQYEALTFRDVVESAGYVPMQHVGGIPHRVLDMDVPSAERVWRSIKHPMTRFVFDTDHPDLDIIAPSIFPSRRDIRARPGTQPGTAPTLNPLKPRLLQPQNGAHPIMSMGATSEPLARPLMLQPTGAVNQPVHIARAMHAKLP